jgi:hypothetical protein
MAQAASKKANSRSGVAVDFSGGPVVDPTANVIALNEAAQKRQDDLREKSDEINKLRIDCQKEVGDLREKHAADIRELQAKHLAELSKAEAERLNSIRQVDREEGAKTAAQILTTVTTLAAQKQTTAETLRNQVAQTAETLRNQVATTQMASQNTFNTTTSDFNKRISQLELAGSEGKGKQGVVDPQMMELVAEMKLMSHRLATGGGKSEGIKDFIGWIFGGLGLITAIVMAAIAIMKG